MMAERSGGGWWFPHCGRLRRVAGHGVAGAGAVLRGHLAVLHDLLDLGSFVLKPDFHLDRERGPEVKKDLNWIVTTKRGGGN